MGKNNTLYNFDETRVESLEGEQCNHFDYDALDSEDFETSFDPDQMQMLGEALREILFWLTMGDINSSNYGQTVMRKTIAMCWVLRPEVFHGMALSEIAKSKGVNTYKQTLSKQAIKFAEKFRIKGRGQRKKLSKNENRTKGNK